MKYNKKSSSWKEICAMEDVRKKVYEALDKMKIKYEVVEHEIGRAHV